jgi:pentatricopeptide repeat protein
MKTEMVFRNFVAVSFTRYRRFSSSRPSAPSSSLPWISPLQLSKATLPKPDPPTETTTPSVEVQRKSKYISHEYAINLIKRERDPQHALEIFNLVAEQKGFNHNCATYATILDKLAWSKKFQAVDAVLRQMTYETCKFHEGIFLNLMKHFSKSSLHERVLEMFYAIQPVAREKPSLKAISTCLNLLVESNRIDLARQLLLHSMKKLELELNTCIYNILVKLHCKNRDLESAFEIVSEMKKSKISYPNLITYSTMMDGLCESGRLKEAIDLFEEMVSKDQIFPDALSYNVLINGFCCGGKVDQARKIMEFMRSNGCNPNVFNYSTLMNGFCKEGRLQEAKEVFDEMRSFGLKSDTVGYTTLINCFCRAGKVDEATELLKEMKERECKADTVTFNVILGGLCREGRFEEALDMLEKLPYDGIYLNKASYRIVLNSLCQKGELNKATELLDLMLGRGLLPHYATSNELLVRLCKAGMVDDAVTALFGLVEMGFKPEPDSWTHVLELICRERKLLSAFELLDELVVRELGFHDWPINQIMEATRKLNPWFDKNADESKWR